MELYEHIIYSIITLVAGYSILYGIVSCIREKTNFSHFVQLLITCMGFGVFGLFVLIGFGQETFSHLLMGLFIGFGLALQPLVKVIINGFIFDGTRIPSADRVIEIPSKKVKGRVSNVGMLHTWIEDNDGHLTMISNNILWDEPIKIYRKENKF